ncbi:Hypothetical predicted protein [Paramuricea clavata]|uniref:Uncharacterized protein n=1 Tax=Paramuricea clavata TaxID=317549 RepID=A0A7D9E037_PARCT|nr:Hypothetical predicted protein [Paramuricea clavata]
MAAIKRIQVVLVIMTVLLMEDNTITPRGEPKECYDYIDLTVSYWRNNSNETIIPILPASICNGTLGGQRWYNYSNLTGIFAMDKGIRLANSTEFGKTFCPNLTLGHLRDESKAKNSSRLVCFAEYASGPYAGKIFFQRLLKVTYCGSFYVYQLPQFECIKNTSVPHTTISGTKIPSTKKLGVPHISISGTNILSTKKLGTVPHTTISSTTIPSAKTLGITKDPTPTPTFTFPPIATTMKSNEDVFEKLKKQAREKLSLFKAHNI